MRIAHQHGTADSPSCGRLPPTFISSVSWSWYAAVAADPAGFRISATAPAAARAPVTIYFSSRASGPESTDTLTYTWDFGDGTKAVTTTPGAEPSTQNVAHTYTAAGTYTARVTVTDQAGNRSARSGSVTVAAPVAFSSGQPFKVLQWNTYKGRTTDTRTEGSKIWLLARWMAAENPDVILLQEVMGTSHASAYKKALEAAMPGTSWSYFYRSDANVNSSTAQGVAILTRLPIIATASMAYTYCPDAQIPQRAAIAVTVPVNGRNVTVFDTHLSSYSGTADAACRYNQAQQLTAWAATFAEPRLLGGDLNASPDEKAIGHLLQTYKDVWREALAGSIATSYPENPPNDYVHTRSERIDYVMWSRGSDLLALLGAQVPDTRDFSNGDSIYSQGLTNWAPHNYAPRVSDHDSNVVTFLVR